MHSVQAFEVFNQLSTKSPRLKYAKEQIRIRYVGIRWKAAHHPLPKNKHVYTSAEHMENFVKADLPLQRTHTVQPAPPLKLPGLPNMAKMGTQANDYIVLEESLENEDMQFIIDAMHQKERLKDNGYGWR